MDKKVVIIGAGPIGCYTAQSLKHYGFEPQLIEEHKEVGRPLHCTGVVGSRLFEDKRLHLLASDAIINTINGAVIHYNGHNFLIERKKVAYVIDRERFDKELSKELDIIYENRFLGVEKNANGYVIETDKDEFYGRIVIGADGANSTLRRVINQDSRVVYYKGLQLRMKTKPRYKDFVEVFLEKNYFFWIVPEGKDVVRIGTISENPHKDLQDFLKTIKVSGKLLEKFGGLVSVGMCENTTKDNLALVGDAACQVKPLSYGGLYFGLKGASILAQCIHENRLHEYDQRWKSELMTEIKIGIKVKDVYNRLSEREIEKIFFFLKSQKTLIEKVADFESHSRLIVEVIKNPTLYPQLGDLLRIFFRAVFLS